MNPNDEAIVRGQRTLVDVRPGALVRYDGRTHRVESVVDFSTAICVDLADEGRRATVPIEALAPYADSVAGGGGASDMDAISEPTWALAQGRHTAVAPLLDGHTRRSVEARAKEVGVSCATLYRWLAQFQGQRTTAALIPKTRGWRAGRGRLDPSVERVIEDVVRTHYLTPQRLSVTRVAQQVGLECHRLNLPAPHYNAVARRIHALPEHERLRARGARELADRRFRPVPGRFPDADFPLAVVQIDHTPLDVMIVDDEHRKSIGRPWLTLAIDVFSRMATGYYLSLDAPCEASVGLCIARSIAPKDHLLQELSVEGTWPVWGVMRKIHVDNGPDFRSGSLRRSCEMYGINLEFRPVKVPRFGGHIERLFGTVARAIHSLPGTTFSSVAERGEYRSDKYAAMTFDELERWLVRFLCDVYHVKVHRELGVSPLRQWERGVFGDKGCGLAPRPTDERRVRLDFMPSFARHVRPGGVSIDGLAYYGETLRSWVGATDPRNPKDKRQFVFRRDPRDISRVWFFDPDASDYYEIPFANRSMPRMSFWEYRAARKVAREKGMATTDEHQVALAMERLRKDADDAARATKSARRTKQRRKHHQRVAAPPAASAAASDTAMSSTEDELLETVEPFEEVW